MRRTGGFTLIELLIAVAIMLIIGAAATPILLSHIKSAKVASLNENILNVKAAFDSWFTAKQGDVTDDDADGDYLDDLLNAGWLSSDPSDTNYDFYIKKYTSGDDVAYYIEVDATVNGPDTTQYNTFLALDEKVDDGDKTTGRIQIDNGDTSNPARLYFKIYADPGLTTWHP